MHAGIPHPPGASTPLGADTPQEQAAPPPGAGTPQEQTPPPGADTPPEQAPTRSRHPLEQAPPSREQAPPPPSRRLLLRTVRILLECILVKLVQSFNCYGYRSIDAYAQCKWALLCLKLRYLTLASKFYSNASNILVDFVLLDQYTIPHGCFYMINSVTSI